MDKDTSVYQFKGKLYIPTPGVTDQDWDVFTEPVYVVPPGDSSALASALQHTLDAAPVMLSHTQVLARRLPVVVRAASARSWRAFASASRSWSVGVKDGKVWATPHRLDDDTFIQRVDAREELGAFGAWDAVALRLLRVIEK